MLGWEGQKMVSTAKVETGQRVGRRLSWSTTMAYNRVSHDELMRAIHPHGTVSEIHDNKPLKGWGILTRQSDFDAQ